MRYFVFALRNREDGFTLIELMVVILIIAILIAVAIPTFLGFRERAQDRAAQSELRTALTTAKAIYIDNQNYGEVDADAMKAAEPSLVFANLDEIVDGAVDVTVAEGTISVYPDGSSGVYLLTASNSGKVFGFYESESGPTQFLSGASVADLNGYDTGDAGFEATDDIAAGLAAMTPSFSAPDSEAAATTTTTTEPPTTTTTTTVPPTTTTTTTVPPTTTTTTVAPPPVTVDLTNSASVTASASSEFSTTYLAGNVLDGIISGITGTPNVGEWASAGGSGDDAYVTIDLGREAWVQWVDAYDRPLISTTCRFNAFNVLTSTDGVTWNVTGTMSGLDPSGVTPGRAY